RHGSGAALRGESVGRRDPGVLAMNEHDEKQPKQPEHAAPAADESKPAEPPVTPAAAPSQQEMAVRSALETVMDPEIGLSVIDLGLIREVQVGPEKTEIKMMLTTPFCPYAPQMIA